MRGQTGKIILTGDWQDIIIKDQNDGEIFYSGVIVFFTNDLLIRGELGQEEILIKKEFSPMTLVGQSNNGFPYQVKGTGFLQLMTLN